VKDWIQACQAALSLPGVETPWKRLEDIGKILSLTGENVDEGITFSQGMAVAWSAEGGDDVRQFLDNVGVGEMSKVELQGVLRRRAECWR
jgi:hypothetical protein